MGNNQHDRLPSRRDPNVQSRPPGLIPGIATIFGAIGSGLFTSFTVDTSTGKWIGYQIIFAVSSSLCSVTPLMVAQQALPLKDIPIGSGLVMFSQTVGAYVSIPLYHYSEVETN